MLRGVVDVVPVNAVIPGRFYFAHGYGGGASFFQCIETMEQGEDGFQRIALYFSINGKPHLLLEALPLSNPVVAIEDVHIRVDPTSIIGSAFTTSMTMGTFLIDGDQAVLAAPNGRHGWTVVNMSNGKLVEKRSDIGWLSFSRWSLVIDDETGSEKTLASFPQEQANLN